MFYFYQEEWHRGHRIRKLHFFTIRREVVCNTIYLKPMNQRRLWKNERSSYLFLFSSLLLVENLPSNEKRPLGASAKAVTLIASVLSHFLRRVSLDTSSSTATMPHITTPQQLYSAAKMRLFSQTTKEKEEFFLHKQNSVSYLDNSLSFRVGLNKLK